MAKIDIDKIEERVNYYIDEYDHPVYQGNGFTDGIVAASKAIKELIEEEKKNGED